jgi:NitT/TauT family transport system ATP-binding protein
LAAVGDAMSAVDVPAQDAHGGRLTIANVSITLGGGAEAFEAVRDVDFLVAAGELVCILGPSGCGKSTLLGGVAGHLAVSRGSMTVDGEAIVGPRPDRGIVFQQHTLFPWKKARDNVAFGPKMRGVGKLERHREADRLLGLVGLKGFGHFYPSQLSGGMQQRVEIARVLINQPRILLMDEPFGALDAQTRALMHEVLLDIWTKIPTTILFVTHDIDEALFLADRVIMMSARPGRIIEDIRMPFGRPRHPELVTEAEFSRLKRHFLKLLRTPAESLPLPRLSLLGNFAA